MTSQMSMFPHLYVLCTPLPAAAGHSLYIRWHATREGAVQEEPASSGSCPLKPLGGAWGLTPLCPGGQTDAGVQIALCALH